MGELKNLFEAAGSPENAETAGRLRQRLVQDGLLPADASWAAVQAAIASELDAIDDEEVEAEFRGGSGWLLVAVGPRGAIVVDWSPGFGAMNYALDSWDTQDCDELGLDPPGDAGVYRARAEIVCTTSWEGERDESFRATSKWEEVVSEHGWIPAEEGDHA